LFRFYFYLFLMTSWGDVCCPLTAAKAHHKASVMVVEWLLYPCSSIHGFSSILYLFLTKKWSPSWLHQNLSFTEHLYLQGMCNQCYWHVFLYVFHFAMQKLELDNSTRVWPAAYRYVCLLTSTRPILYCIVSLLFPINCFICRCGLYD